jgi:hypothetical protein
VLRVPGVIVLGHLRSRRCREPGKPRTNGYLSKLLDIDRHTRYLSYKFTQHIQHLLSQFSNRSTSDPAKPVVSHAIERRQTGQTYFLLDELSSDRVEQRSGAAIRSDRLFPINLGCSPEQWPAEFHPSLDDPSVFTDHPVQHCLYEQFRYMGRRVFKRDKVKRHADLRVGYPREPVQRVQVKNMTRGERWVSLQAFQEHGCMLRHQRYQKSKLSQPKLPR